MANNIFRGDPFTGIGYVQYSDGYQFESTVEEWSNGLFTVSNGQLVDTSNPFIRTTLGQQDFFSMEQFDNNIYNLISATRAGDVNRVIATDTMRVASGTIEIMTPSGDFHAVEFSGVTVAKPGYQWAVYTQESGIERLVNVKAIYRSSGELQAALGPGYRLATMEEVILNAAAWATTAELAKLIREEFADELTEEELAQPDYELVQSVLLKIGSLSGVTVRSSKLFQR